MGELTSRVEDILQATIDGVDSSVKPRSRVEELLDTLNTQIQTISGGKSWIGITTTVLTDGSSTNPITINGSQVTAEAGNITSYNGTEFIFNGSIWQEFGQKVKIGTIALGTNWTESNDVYSQTVTVSGVTVTTNSKVDLQFSASQLADLMEDGVTAIVAENNNGVITIKALGAETSSSMTVQCTVTEVEV